MNYAEIISQIRDDLPIVPEDISHVASGIANEEMSDAQVAAFAMAVLWRGLSDENTVALTTAMRDTGEVFSWDVPGPVVDKHSTGGVGDCVSLALAPILACAGLYVPMISGRGLGHTGGTLDKLESMTGFNNNMSLEAMRAQLSDIGVFMAGQSAQLAPADKRFYAIRDVTGTVPSIELITASILSKKLAAGLENLVLDVKCGLGAFMKTQTRAEALAQKLVQTANNAGCQTTALITSMDVPLASAAGNALEVAEILSLLEGQRMDARLYIITKALCVEILEAVSVKNAASIVDKIVTSGEGMARFEEMVAAQGGPKGTRAIRKDQQEAPLIEEFLAPEDMDYHGFDAYEVGMAVVELGGGRRQVSDSVDKRVGVSDILEAGPVRKGDVLARIHASDETRLERAEERLFLSLLKNPAGEDTIIGSVS